MNTNELLQQENELRNKTAFLKALLSGIDKRDKAPEPVRSWLQKIQAETQTALEMVGQQLTVIEDWLYSTFSRRIISTSIKKGMAEIVLVGEIDGRKVSFTRHTKVLGENSYEGKSILGRRNQLYP